MKRFLFLTLLSLGFAACNSLKLDDSDGALSGEVETSYISINLSAIDNSTRAAGGVYEEGTDAEREVKSAYFFFFDAEGNAFPVTATSGPATAPDASGVNWISANLSNVGSGDMPNVSDIKGVVLVLNAYVGTYPSQIVAVLNWAPTPGTKYSLEDLYAATDIRGTGDAFVMSNAVYAADSKAVEGTPIKASDIYKDAASANANPITIYVERIAAKVKVTPKTDAETYVSDNRFKVTKSVMLGGSSKDVYVQVTGWELHNDFTQSKLLKDINPTWTDLGFTWNDAAWHRCYWSTSLGFDKIGTNTFPSTFSLSMDSSTYVGENTNYVLADASKCTKVILKAQLQEKDGETYKALPLARWYSTYYTGKDDLLTAVANTIKYQYYKQNGSDYDYIEPGDLDVVKDGNMVKFALSSAAEGKNWYIKSEGVYVSKTKDEMNALLGSIEKAVFYESGETLYSIDIAHLGAQLAGDQLGDYGVVRNHIYNVIIKSFGGFGSPVYVPGANLDYPGDPIVEGKDYVSAEVRVLSWRLVSQEMDVQPQP